MVNQDDYRGWQITLDHSDDATFPRIARAAKDNEHSRYAEGQTDEEALARVKAQVDHQESMGS